MVASTLVILGIRIKLLIDDHNTLRLGICASPASDEHIDALYIDIMLFKNGEYDVLPHVKLIIDCRKTQKKRSIMEDALCEYILVVIEHAYLRRCRTWIDYKKPVSAHGYIIAQCEISFLYNSSSSLTASEKFL